MEKGGDSYRPLWVMGSRAKGEKLERAEAPAKRSLWHKCGWVMPKLNNQTTYWKDCTSSCYKWRWWFSHSVVSDSCNPMGCSPPGSSVHEILQKRILQWIAISFSRRSSQLRNWTRASHIAGGFFTSWASRESRVHVYRFFILHNSGYVVL